MSQVFKTGANTPGGHELQAFGYAVYTAKNMGPAMLAYLVAIAGEGTNEEKGQRIVDATSQLGFVGDWEDAMDLINCMYAITNKLGEMGMHDVIALYQGPQLPGQPE